MLLRKEEYSLFSMSVKILILIYGFFITLITAIFLFLYHNTQSNLYDNYCRTVEYCLSEITNNLTIVDRSVITMLYNDPDLAKLTYAEDNLTISVCESRLKRTLESYLMCYSTADGLFLYDNKNDCFVSSSRSSRSSFSAYFRNKLRSMDFSSGFQDIRRESTAYMFCQIDGEYCLVRMFTRNCMIGGVWVNLDTIMNSLKQSTSEDALCIFLNASETDAPPIGDQHMDTDALEQIMESGEQFLVYAGNRYLKFQTSPSFCQENLLILTPYSQIQQTIKLHYRLFGLFVAILTLCILSTFILFSRQLRLPIRELNRISETIKDGWQPDLLRQQMTSRCKEVREINEEVLRLLEHVDSLENQVLKETLLKKDYELISLRNQISPHFLINCLSVISSMAGTSVSYTVLRSMIATLTRHLRYILSTKSFVSLADEIRFVRNYYALNEYRYPGNLSWQFDISDSCDNAAIFPCSILMLSENSLKHNLSADEKLKVTITAWEEQDESGKTYIHIRHTDSGSGFPEHMLNNLNCPNSFIDDIADGTRIGLYNIKRRILLSFTGSNASIRFSNNPESSGAQVDIIVPYISYQDS